MAGVWGGGVRRRASLSRCPHSPRQLAELNRDWAPKLAQGLCERTDSSGFEFSGLGRGFSSGHPCRCGGGCRQIGGGLIPVGASIVDISLPGEDSFLAGREEAKKLLFLGMAGGQVRLSLCEEAPAPPFFLKKAVPALGWVQ